jgi:hypothetical protein
MASGRKVFISYASQNRALIRPFVQALTAAGLSVWWDQEIDRGHWGSRIQEELDAADTVLAFLSKAAMASGYVFAESQRAMETNKLVPVRIDNEPLRFEFHGLIAFVQSHFFLEPLDPDGSAFRRLCAACFSELPTSPATERGEPEIVAAWFNADRTISEIAFAIAVATLEMASYDVVELAARLLQDVLEPAQPTADGTAAKRPFVLNARARRLASIEAECFRIGHERLKSLDVECVRFTRPERAAAVLDYVWRELDGIREPLCHWLNLLAEQTAQQLKLMTGIAVGKLAQADFTLVHDRLIHPWAMSDDSDRRETADIALSVAAFAPNVREATEQLLDSWADADADPAERRAAAEFSLGYAGARFPVLGLPLLRKLLRQEKADSSEELAQAIEQAIRRRVRRAIQAEDSSLFDIDALMEGLAGWIAAPENEPDPRWAIRFSLSVLGMLPLHRLDETDRFSLSALLDGKRARGASVQAILAALERPDMRDRVREMINRWIDERPPDRRASDPLDQLAGALLEMAGTERARARINHLFRHVGSGLDPSRSGSTA